MDLALSESVSLRFHPHASVVLVMGAVAVFFWWAFTQLGPQEIEPGEVVATRRQRSWIVAGFVATLLFSYWPLHDIAEKYLFMAHMTQHTVFTLVAPACFLLGSPPWLWRWALRHRLVRVVRFGAKPIVALVVFNSLIAVTHYPAVVERSLHNEPFHFLVHFVLFGSATLMWIPVINRNPALPRLRTPVKMVYLFAQSIVPTVPASFLTFSETPLYKTYQAAPRMIHGLSAVGDQQIAAAIMKLGAGSLLWSVVGVLFIQWWRDSRDGLEDDRSFGVSDGPRRVVTVRPQIAGMTITGQRVAPEVLTWEAVRAEFDVIEAAQQP
jgi:putative membrane protein